jgi:hypothetical protein
VAAAAAAAAAVAGVAVAVAVAGVAVAAAAVAAAVAVVAVAVAAVAVAVAVAVVARRRPVGEVGAGPQKAAESQQLVAGARVSPPWVERARESNSRRRRRMRTVRVQKQPMYQSLFCDQPALQSYP